MATSEKTNNRYSLLHLDELISLDTRKFRNYLNFLSRYNELLKRVDPLRVEYNYRKLLHDARKNGVWCNDYHLSALSSYIPINGELTDNFICGFYNNQIGKFHYTAIVPNSIKSLDLKNKTKYIYVVGGGKEGGEVPLLWFMLHRFNI
ncbi:hypothetical protein BpHYR1_050080 [Brachionus plicatilis]|uniref:Uncharacterized protein n=1 Tax=Brachionus plicatilis TaxID=10195 RepID=A0A3M7PK70_BRAPC|nr:hypothetical protein BpHYR1_050080 [Brachionus plicatilis]